MAKTQNKPSPRTRVRVGSSAQISNSMGAAQSVNMQVSELTAYPGNPRSHTQEQIGQLAASIKAFGYINPIIVDGTGQIIAGHARFEAVKLLGLKTIPVIRVEHLSEDEVRAYRIADNRLAENSAWDDGLLKVEIGHLVEIDLKGELSFELDVTGFNTPEIDVILDGTADKDDPPPDPDDGFEDAVGGAPISKPGDLWDLGQHRILCGSALDAGSYQRLLETSAADMLFSDPPYNVPVNGHVRGKANSAHAEFAMASGEMSRDEFTRFLSTFLDRSSHNCRDGAVLMVCMDWRHHLELQLAAEEQKLKQLNLCVWAKTNGGQGSLYRSQHELVLVYRKGDESHQNNVQLGKFGRYRTNVWTYAGVNTFGRNRDEELRIHPTVKPVALVADAIRDVTKHGDLVLDPFGGSGSTLIAAERSGRRARLIELEPRYVDVTIRRWQKLTGKTAIHSGTGQTFDEVAEARLYGREN